MRTWSPSDSCIDLTATLVTWTLHPLLHPQDTEWIFILGWTIPLNPCSSPKTAGQIIWCRTDYLPVQTAPSCSDRSRSSFDYMEISLLPFLRSRSLNGAKKLFIEYRTAATLGRDKVFWQFYQNPVSFLKHYSIVSPRLFLIGKIKNKTHFAPETDVNLRHLFCQNKSCCSVSQYTIIIAMIVNS